MSQECRPKTGWLSGQTYCAVHGRSAGWPCTESTALAIDSRTLHGVPSVFTGTDTTYREQRTMAEDIRDHSWTTPTEQGLAISLLAVIEDFDRTLVELGVSPQNWTKE